MSFVTNPIMSNDENVVLYENLAPNHLYKLIETLEWDLVANVLKEEPQTVFTWVVLSCGDDEECRRLPIHEAAVRQPTAHIIAMLLNIHPESAQLPDGNGRNPIHHACLHNAHVDVLNQLLYLYPKGCEVKDDWGQTAKAYAASNANPDPQIIQALFATSHSQRAKHIRQLHQELSHDTTTTTTTTTNETKEEHDYTISQELVPYQPPSTCITTETYGPKGIWTLNEEEEAYTNTAGGAGGGDTSIHEGYELTFAKDSQVTKLQTEIQKLQVELLLMQTHEYQILQSQQECNEAQHQVADLCEEKSRLLQQVQESQVQHSDYRATTTENTVLKQLNQDLKRQIQDLSHQLVVQTSGSSSSSNKSVKQQVQQLRLQQQTHHVEFQQLQQLIKSDETQYRAIQSEVDELNALYLKMTSALVQKSKEYFQIQAQLQSLRSTSTTTVASN